MILSNQAGGLTASVPKAFPNTQIQSCNQHTIKAMKMRYRKSGYKKAEIKGIYKKGKKDIRGLADYSWQYIKSLIINDLKANRKALIDQLKPEDKAYIKDVW